jgi:YggT family protein
MSFIADLLSRVVTLLIWAFVGRAIISWLVVAGMRHELLFRLNQVLGVITEPIIAPIRRFIPPLGAIDITPMVAIIILVIIVRVLNAL